MYYFLSIAQGQIGTKENIEKENNMMIRKEEKNRYLGLKCEK